MKDLTQEQLEIIKKAISFMKTNLEQAQDELDESISEEKLSELEKYLYE